jgi:DNA-directed RNA polymerase specialized sigma24 family protein
VSNEERPQEKVRQTKENEVTLWIKSVEAGDDSSAGQLWSYCFPKLLSYSKKKLPDHLRRALDEEDVALSAFKSFCLAAAKGSFPQLEGRDDLWKLLLCIANRKAQNYVRRELREKRGGGQVRGESIFEMGGNSSDPNDVGIGNVAGKMASPEMLAQFTDDARAMIDMLQDDTIKTIALLRMEGYSVEEIAERLECGKRTIERRLTLIRKTWSESEKPKDSIESQS